MQPPADRPETEVHPARAVRVALVLAGTGFVGLGILGAFLPVLPTTPFMLLAAACYARASTRFYNGLLNNRAFGPTIREWRRYRSIPFRTKWTAIGLMAVTLTASIVFAVEDPWLRAALAAFGVLLAVWMARIPSRDRPAGRS
jgi:uncharacterized membrane protein YbaN (DUF454 family)